MKQFIQSVVIAAITVFVAGSTVGCGLIGYAVGGAIDATKYVQDTVSVKMVLDSTTAELQYRSFVERQRFASFMKQAESGNLSRVAVITSNGLYTGDALRADTVLALRHEPEGEGREGLLPGDLVALTTRDMNLAQIRGRVVRLNKRAIFLQVDGQYRGFSLNMVNTVFLSDERVISGSELASPDSSRRLIRVPGLVLGEESPPLFIPLKEVEWLRAMRPIASWGVARTTFYSIGVFSDIGLFYLCTRYPASGPATPNHVAIPLTLLFTAACDVLPILPP